MTRFFIATITAIAISCFAILSAQIEEGSFGSEKMPVSQPDGYPFKIEVRGDSISKAEFSHPDDLEDEHLHFSYVTGEVRGIFYYIPECREGAYTTLDFDRTIFNWRENPFFSQTKFHTVSLSLGYFSHRFSNWRWVGEATINVDTDHFNVSEYANYDLMLWGRYEYSCDWNVHLGLLAATGMKIDRVYPIFGFDWTGECWKVNAVFPINMSLVYLIDECWSVALAARVFDARHRVGSDEPLPKALVFYENAGGEIVINYDCERRVSINVHAGYTVGGRFKIANRHYEDKRHFRLKPASYFGSEIAFRF